MYTATAGLVLRAVDYKESSVILTVLTPHDGKLTVTVKGAKRKGCKNAAASQLLTLSEMTLFSSRDRYTLTESRVIEEFRGIRESVEKLALGSYFAELLDAMSDEDLHDIEVMRLGLNALYALSRGKQNDKLIKAAFELRLMCIGGFTPRITAERERDAPIVFDFVGGMVQSKETDESLRTDCAVISKSCFDAISYIVTSPSKRLYSFSVGAGTLTELSRVCERFLLAQTGRRFGTLDFYHSL